MELPADQLGVVDEKEDAPVERQLGRPLLDQPADQVVGQLKSTPEITAMMMAATAIGATQRMKKRQAP